VPCGEKSVWKQGINWKTIIITSTIQIPIPTLIPTLIQIYIPIIMTLNIPRIIFIFNAKP
jgi:hypothetical protein